MIPSPLACVAVSGRVQASTAQAARTGLYGPLLLVASLIVSVTCSRGREASRFARRNETKRSGSPAQIVLARWLAWSTNRPTELLRRDRGVGRSVGRCSLGWATAPTWRCGLTYRLCLCAVKWSLLSDIFFLCLPAAVPVRVPVRGTRCRRSGSLQRGCRAEMRLVVAREVCAMTLSWLAAPSGRVRVSLFVGLDR